MRGGGGGTGAGAVVSDYESRREDYRRERYEEKYGDPKCPTCGSKNIVREGTYTPSSLSPYYECEDCGAGGENWA